LCEPHQEDAGIKAGDRMVSLGNTKVATIDDLATTLARIKPGARIPVVIDRNGKKLTLHAKVGQLTT
jgi:serine protease Do